MTENKEKIKDKVLEEHKKRWKLHWNDDKIMQGDISGFVDYFVLHAIDETEKLTKEETLRHAIHTNLKICERSGCTKQSEIALCIEHLELAEKEARADERVKCEKASLMIEDQMKQAYMIIQDIQKINDCKSDDGLVIVESVRDFYNKGYSDGFNDGDRITEDMKILEQKNERKRIASLIEKEIENWKKTTYCEICGSKLELQDIEKMVWACGTMEQDPTKEGMLRRKEGRNAADEHYSKSRRYYSFEWEKTAETVLKALQDLLKKISGTEKEAYHLLRNELASRASDGSQPSEMPEDKR